MSIHPDLSLAEDPGDTAALGLACSIALVVFYASFILFSAFASSIMAAPVTEGSAVSVGFAYGLTVIGVGIALTFVYGVVATRRENVRRVQGARG